MPVTRSLPRLRPATSRTLRPLVTLLACVPIACNGTSEPHALAASLALRSHVPTGILNSREDERVKIGERYREPIVVQALGPTGRPTAGVVVTATPSHGGLVAPVGGAEDAPVDSAVTGPSGTAAFWWTPGPAVDYQTLTLSAPGAEDLVVRVYAFWPAYLGSVTFADSTLSVGESTTAHLTLRTAAGEEIAYNRSEATWKIRWSTSDPRILAVSGGDAPAADGSRTTTTGPVTITAMSPGRVSIFGAIDVSYRIGSQSSIFGFDSLTAHPVCTGAMATPLVPGQPVNGVMTAQDCRLETAAPYDKYRLDVAIGQRVQVDLASNQFDPYLILLDADGNWLTGDDWSGGGTTARITFTAEATTYYLQATSLAPGGDRELHAYRASSAVR